MNDTVVAIVSAFFVIGILVGIVTVIAAAVFRADRRGRQDDPEDFPDYEPDDSWDDARTDGHPRWPGDADTDFRGRQGRPGGGKLPRVPGRGRGAR